MTCNYFDYMKLTDKLFYGVALTDEHLNNATEIIRQYLVNGGAYEIVESLGIGLYIYEVTTPKYRMIKKRFVFTKDEVFCKELTTEEIRGIGHFLKYGIFYGKYSNNSI